MKKSVESQETPVIVYFSERKQCFYSHRIKEHSPTHDFKPFVECKPSDFNAFLVSLPEKKIEDRVTLLEVCDLLNCFIQSAEGNPIFNVA